MPNSLKVMIAKLKHKGCITADDYNALITKLDGHDAKIRADERKKTLEEANKKLIPVKPDYEGDGYADGQMVYDVYICPTCATKYEVDYDYYKYCPNCGQALDMEEG